MTNGVHPFELRFRDTRRLITFVKMCEALYTHSDTALFKVTRKGVYINVTDFESMCSAEGRLSKGPEDSWSINEEFTSKILLDSFINELKRVIRNKQSVIIFGEHPHILKIRTLPQKHHGVGVHRSSGMLSSAPTQDKTILSTEHRMRVFHIVSRSVFVEKSGDYAAFRIVNAEFNRIITMKAIVSGVSGGVGEIEVVPDGDTDCDLVFSVKSGGGSVGKLTIHTSTVTTDEVRMLKVSDEPIRISYLLAYLKRSQNIMSVLTEFTIVYVSKLGIMLETEVKDNMSIVLFTNSLEGVDLDSYS